MRSRVMDQIAIIEIRDQIIAGALSDVVFDGWTWEGLENAAKQAGYDTNMIAAVFPDRLSSGVEAFADWADRQMLLKLDSLNPEDMRVRDRVRAGVLARLEVLQPHKEEERTAIAYWAFPGRSLRAARIVWRTADRIWNWAGDEAKDYNHYTKRGLLSGVLVSTTLAWLDEGDEDMERTKAFLDRRIENVMKLGKVLGKIKK